MRKMDFESYGFQTVLDLQIQYLSDIMELPTLDLFYIPYLEPLVAVKAR